VSVPASRRRSKRRGTARATSSRESARSTLGATAVLIGRDVIRAAIGGGPKGVELQMARLGSVLKKGMLMTGCPDLASIDRNILV